MQTALDALREKGVADCYLESGVDNHSAHRFSKNSASGRYPAFLGRSCKRTIRTSVTSPVICCSLALSFTDGTGISYVSYFRSYPRPEFFEEAPEQVSFAIRPYPKTACPNRGCDSAAKRVRAPACTAGAPFGSSDCPNGLLHIVPVVGPERKSGKSAGVGQRGGSRHVAERIANGHRFGNQFRGDDHRVRLSPNVFGACRDEDLVRPGDLEALDTPLIVRAERSLGLELQNRLAVPRNEPTRSEDSRRSAL